VLTYGLFYYTYIPSPSFTLPIHLQFPDSPSSNPYAIIPLTSPSLSSNQPYDVTVDLSLPRTKTNTAVGNFMLDLHLLSTSSPIYSNALAPYNDNLTHFLLNPKVTTIASSRRPASLTYRSIPLDLAHKLLFGPLYLTNFFTESETLSIPLLESANFGRGKVPKAMSLELQTPLLGIGMRARRVRMQVYWVKITFTARLEGLRWWMYKHRVLSFVICTTMFWAVEMAVAMSVWAGVSLLYWQKGQKLGNGEHDQDETFKMEDVGKVGLVRVKKEEDDEEDESEGMSDTSRSFPTFTRQPPLRYSGSANARIKQEDEDEDREREEVEQTLPAVPTTAAEADVEDEDEDEDADFVLEQRFERLGDSGGRGFDSGIGSSMDSGAGSGNVWGDLRKRTSKG